MAHARILLSLAILAVFAAVAVQAASEPEVKIDTGKLKGKSDGTITAFLGIPFATPPVGDLRWKPPAPVKWNGTREATSSARAACKARFTTT